MNEYIPSKSVRKYVEETGRIFADDERAALIYHNPIWSLTKKQAFLREIADTTQDVSLKRQIEERLAYEAACIELISREEDTGYVYKLTENDERFDDPEEFYFPTFQKAYQYVKQVNRKDKRAAYFHVINKIRLISSENGPEEIMLRSNDCEDNFLTYRKGNLTSFQTSEIDEASYIKTRCRGSGTRFEKRFVDIPNPFARGDIVKVLTAAKGEELLGVVCAKHGSLAGLEDRKQEFCRSEPLMVDMLHKDGYFRQCYAEVGIVESYELPEKDPRYPVLTLASYLLRGEADLEEFQIACEDYIEKKKEKYKKGNIFLYPLA